MQEDDTTEDDFEECREAVRRVLSSFNVSNVEPASELPVYALRMDTAPGFEYRELGYRTTDECLGRIVADAEEKLSETRGGEIPEPDWQSAGGRGKKGMTQAKMDRKSKQEPIGRFIRICPKDDVLIAGEEV